MNDRMAQDFFEEMVAALATGDDRRVRIPAAEFNRLARAGGFDDMADDAYSSCLHATNEVGRLWACESDVGLWELARRALASCDLTGVEVGRLAWVLARAWTRRHPDHAEDPYVRQPFRYFPEADDDPAAGSPLLSMTAHDIAQRLSERVWGQDEAVRVLSLMLWHHARQSRRVTLLMGPTGSGKTLLAETLATMWPHVAWVDGSQVSMDGWSGSVKFNQCLRGMARPDAERAIVIVDEADKMFEPRYESHGGNVSSQVQTQLLKMMDGGHAQMVLGTDSRAAAEPVSMARVSFLLMGTFERMLDGMSHERRSAGFAADNSAVDGAAERLPTTADLERHGGVRREIAGRVNAIARVRPLGVSDYVALLRDPTRSPAARLAEEYGIPVELTDAECLAMAERAEASGLGVRSLESQLEERLDGELWEGEEAAAAPWAGGLVSPGARVPGDAR